MKVRGLILLVIIATASLTLFYTQFISTQKSASEDEFYFGISFGQETAHQAKVLIDKVKNFTNFLLINSFDLTTKETQLNEVCDYAAQANLKFVVYFDFISRIRYPWHQAWLDTAQERWGDKFLGVHLRDEPGGKQIERANNTISDAIDYSDAARKYVEQIASSNSSIDAKKRGISLFTSDYALYWWDYLAGYDTVFAELGWNISSAQQIALCRGAANLQGKDWGSIITWTYSEPPYLSSPQEIYQDMVLSYQAGAKYVVVFNHPTYPEDNLYGIMSQDHFEVMEQFWNHSKTNPRIQATKGEVALVLPKDYGWGMRRSEYITIDRIWGLWPEDEKATQILENINKLVTKYGVKLDVVYEDKDFPYIGHFSRIYFWNSTIV